MGSISKFPYRFNCFMFPEDYKMMDVQFHRDMFERAKAAVNVKVNTRFYLTDRLKPYFARLGYSEYEFDALVDSFLESIEELWWNETVQEAAKDIGFAGVYSEGRSDGWAVPHPYIYEEDLEEYPKLLEKYNKFKAFCKQSVDGLDDLLYRTLRDEWYEEEKAFLYKHSISVRSLMHRERERCDDCGLLEGHNMEIEH